MMQTWDSIWRPRHRSAVRRRDPLTIGVWLAVNVGWTGTITAIGATIAGYAVIGAALLGASLLAGAFAPKPTAPESSDRQSTIKQPVGPRVRFYGRNKVGGTLAFYEQKDGNLYSQTTLNEGEISAIQEVWLNDDQVTLDSSGYVNEAPYVYTTSGGGGGVVGGGGTSTTTHKVARVLFKMGASNQTVHSVLDSVFPEVTSEHRLRGVANVLSIFQEVPTEKIGEVYPQYAPQVRVVADCSLVKSVRTGIVGYSDNPADCIYDYLTGKDGAGFPYGSGLLESQVDLASFQAFADLCDEPVPFKAGGTIKRYRLAGGFGLNEEMRAVLDRMCKTCDADLYINGAGKMAIRGGRWVAPTLTLDSDLGHIISAEFQQGRGALAAFNELNITYTDPAQDYLESEAERWLDSSNIALRGKVLSEQLDLGMVPEHAQARRLGKIHSAKSNPAWVGTVVTNFYGFNALGEDTVTIKFGPLGIDATFLIQSVKILDDLTGVQLSVTSLGASAYAWDAALEEGQGPSAAPDTGTPVTLDPPADFNVSAADFAVSGTSLGTYLVATWTEPARVALSQQIEYRLAGDPSWTQMSVSADQGFAQSNVLVDAADYEVRGRTLSPSGNGGDYTDLVEITANADTTTPDDPTDVVGTGGDGMAVLGWTNSVSSNSVGVLIYRNTIDDFGASDLLASIYGSPSVAMSMTNTEAVGTYYYWLLAFTGSGDVSDAVATGAITVS